MKKMIKTCKFAQNVVNRNKAMCLKNRFLRRVLAYLHFSSLALLASCGGQHDLDSSDAPEPKYVVSGPSSNNASEPNYLVGGTVQGLASGSTLTLQNSNGDSLVMTADGGFAFPTRLSSASPFSLRLVNVPAGQACTQTYGASDVPGTDYLLMNVLCGLLPQVSASDTGNLLEGRTSYSMTVLPDARVLVSGGHHIGPGFISRSELYNAASGTWSATGSLTDARSGHSATLLPEVRVLIAGGKNAFQFPSPGPVEALT